MKQEKMLVSTQHEGKTIFLHRMIMEIKLGRPLLPYERVEFVNGNTLDCRKYNLRLKQRKVKNNSQVNV